ncbi:MAG TPA: stage 0 sporulation protein J [Chloroflexi bacterium]|jgi:ParB family chromosome partitioning protein|nr:stage 0 sporulation protein J [Chloroflexota bacterium]HAL25404.1 stage 0 sporulation protein J [Chloroflexota bacterium]
MLTKSGKSFREAGTRIFQQEREAQHGIVSLLASKGPNSIKELPVEKVVPNPEQPRMTFHEETLQELAASIREHGVLQPILVRPAGDAFQIIAGERRWRASKLAGKETIPAIIERFDDATALEIALIENLQREDLSPLDEAIIYKKMTDELGYSIRNLAGKLGKDKGYVENRLRLAMAPDDVREMVAARYDTLSAAYELMKIDDKRRRKSLAKQVVAGKLTLIRLRDKVERVLNPEQAGPRSAPAIPPLRDDSLITATRKLNEALQELARAVGEDGSSNIADQDRTNLAKFLTISRARMDNLVARLRSR